MDENSKCRRILIRKSILFNFAFMVHHHTTSFSRCNFDFKKSGHEKNARFHEFLLLDFIQKQAGANDKNSLITNAHYFYMANLCQFLLSFSGIIKNGINGTRHENRNNVIACRDYKDLKLLSKVFSCLIP